MRIMYCNIKGEEVRTMCIWYKEDLHIKEAPYNYHEMLVYVGVDNFKRLVWVIAYENMFNSIEQKMRHKVRFKINHNIRG